MRRSYQTRKLERHSRKPAELLLVPMIGRASCRERV